MTQTLENEKQKCKNTNKSNYRKNMKVRNIEKEMSYMQKNPKAAEIIVKRQEKAKYLIKES